ncbi:Aldo/keto reductase, partial [Rhizophagus irregularis]
TLRRAYKVHPIAAVQIEYSPWTLDIETNGIMEACRELGVTIVAYSPLGRGFLTGRYKSIDDFEPNDFRRLIPRFQEKKGVTPGQLCLSWILAQGDNMIVIPGTRKIKHLEENVEAVKVNLSSEKLAEIRQIINSIEIIGNRYNDFFMKKVRVRLVVNIDDANNGMFEILLEFLFDFLPDSRLTTGWWSDTFLYNSQRK